MTRTCANCEFWHATDSVLEGQCRRHAPRTGAHWVKVQSTDWCGEHTFRGNRTEPLDYRKSLLKVEPWPLSHRGLMGEDC